MVFFFRYTSKDLVFINQWKYRAHSQKQGWALLNRKKWVFPDHKSICNKRPVVLEISWITENHALVEPAILKERPERKMNDLQWWWRNFEVVNLNLQRVQIIPEILDICITVKNIFYLSTKFYNPFLVFLITFFVSFVEPSVPEDDLKISSKLCSLTI